MRQFSYNTTHGQITMRISWHTVFKIFTSPKWISSQTLGTFSLFDVEGRRKPFRVIIIQSLMFLFYPEFHMIVARENNLFLFKNRMK